MVFAVFKSLVFLRIFMDFHKQVEDKYIQLGKKKVRGRELEQYKEIVFLNK